jgi:hypothetical protein
MQSHKHIAYYDNKWYYLERLITITWVRFETGDGNINVPRSYMLWVNGARETARCELRVASWELAIVTSCDPCDLFDPDVHSVMIQVTYRSYLTSVTPGDLIDPVVQGHKIQVT